MALIPGNPVVGGTVLRRAAIQSPNFSLGPPMTGWSIDQDGNAFFETVTIGGGVVRVTFAPGQPGSPNTGDVWFSTSDGTVHHWDGSTWANFQYGTGAIQNQAITNPLLASSVTARSIGGITTTISATAPGSPVTGDIWIDSANGNQLQQWSGSAWVALSWTATDVISAATITGGLIAASTIAGGNIIAGTITASLIAANTITAAQIAANTITAAQIAASTITAAQLAAGIVYAGIVDATTITGARFIAEGSTGEILCYSGAPAANNLVLSVSPAAGTDSAGNAYLAGTMAYAQAGAEYQAVQLVNGKIQLRTAATEAGPWGTQAQILLDASNNLDVTAAGNMLLTADSGGSDPTTLSLPAGGWAQSAAIDGNTYDVSRLTLITPGQTVSSTSPTLLTGLTCPVLGSGTYRIRAVLLFKGGSAAGTAIFTLTGPAASASMVSWLFSNSASGGMLLANPAFGSGATSPGLITTQLNQAAMECTVTFSATGTLALKCQEGTSGDTVVIAAGGYLEVVPVS